MITKVPDRLFVQEVLGGKYRTEEPGRGTRFIAEIEKEEWPDLKSSRLPWLGAAALIFVICAAFVLVGQVLHLTVPFVVLPAAMGGVIVLTLFVSCRRERRSKAIDKRLQEACMELSGLADEQRSFLARLDDRMVKYFNSNTISDSYTLFVLMQLRDLVERRLQKVCALLSDPSPQHLVHAHRLFAKPLSVRESVIAGVGRSYPVPISTVRSIVGPLLEYLQENLLALETEQTEMNDEATRTEGWKAA